MWSAPSFLLKYFLLTCSKQSFYLVREALFSLYKETGLQSDNARGRCFPASAAFGLSTKGRKRIQCLLCLRFFCCQSRGWWICSWQGWKKIIINVKIAYYVLKLFFPQLIQMIKLILRFLRILKFVIPFIRKR